MGETTVPYTRVPGIDTADIGRRYNLDHTHGLGLRTFFKHGENRTRYIEQMSRFGRRQICDWLMIKLGTKANQPYFGSS